MDDHSTRHSMNSKSLAYHAYRRLEEMIVMLELQPGKTMSESSICDLIDIGRTPVREALKRLADDSLVSILTRRGVEITKIDVKQQLYLVELRRVLEGLVCSRAARRRSNDDVEELKRAVEAMNAAVKARDVAAFLDADKATNLLISSASRNAYLQKAIAPLHSVSRRFWYTSYLKKPELAAPAEFHVKIIKAIIDGDEKAAFEASQEYMQDVENATRLALDLDL